jgi:hypothetical protein
VLDEAGNIKEWLGISIDLARHSPDWETTDHGCANQSRARPIARVRDGPGARRSDQPCDHPASGGT